MYIFLIHLLDTTISKAYIKLRSNLQVIFTWALLNFVKIYHRAVSQWKHGLAVKHMPDQRRLQMLPFPKIHF